MKHEALPFIKQVWILLPLVALLAAWQGYSTYYPHSDFFVGSPHGIIREVISLLSGGSLIYDFTITGLEAICGFVLGCTLGTCVGLLLWYYSRLRFYARFYVLVLGSIPIYALSPALVFWFGNGFLSKVIIAFLSTFFLSTSQAFTGASVRQQDYFELFKAFGATRNQYFWKVTVPTAAIWVISGARLNVSYAILGAFIGELISSQSGLGNMIMVAEGLYNINRIWVGILGMILIAFMLNTLVLPFERWASSRKLV